MKTSQYAQATKTLTEFIDWSKDIRCDFANELFSKGKYIKGSAERIDKWDPDDIINYKGVKKFMDCIKQSLNETTFRWEKEDNTFIIK
jgi:hypothetical protein